MVFAYLVQAMARVEQMNALKNAIARLVLIVGLIGLSTSAMAQDAEKQSLGQAASDPTASLMSFQLQSYYSSALYNLPEQTSTRLQFRVAIPYSLGNTNNIARVTLPYIVDSPSGTSGFADLTIFNLTVFDRPWGRWGAGVVTLLPTGKTGLSAEKFAIGPAFGFTAPTDKLLIGLFNQNLFTVSGDSSKPDVNISTFQPILNYSLGNHWAVGLSEMTFVYDWDASEFTSIPLGFKLSKLVNINGKHVQFIGSYEHNFYDKSTGAKDTFQFTMKLLLPK